MSEARRSPATGLLMVLAAVSAGVGSTILGGAFDWPASLDLPAAEALPAFAEHETAIRIGFYLNLLSSLALVPVAYGLAARAGWTGAPGRTLTAFGVGGAFMQVLGWVRWPLVVPGLADRYLAAEPGSPERAAVGAGYDLINAYAGGAVGEHLGWVLQGIWAVGTGILLVRSRLLPVWLSALGAGLAVLWLPLTAASGFGSHAGVLGTVAGGVYTLWFLWLAAAGGVLAVRRSPAPATEVR